MAITFLDLAKKILTQEKKAMSYTEIWKVAVETSQEKLVSTSGKSPWQTLGARLYIDVRDNPNSEFTTYGTNPKRFLLKSQQGIIPQNSLNFQTQSTEKVGTLSYKEKDLHQLMVYYGYYYLKAFLKTINASSSSKKSYKEWSHPDIVGCYFPFTDWVNEVVDLSNAIGNNSIKLFSFELKRELNFSNLRESYFQAVSNSSWANEGYLAAADINEDDEFLDELKRLSSAFGIGIIRLNIEDPDACEILLPAKTKDTIDWNTVNKMADMNTDFKKFLSRIKTDMTSKEARQEKYDKVMEKETLINSLTKK